MNKKSVLQANDALQAWVERNSYPVLPSGLLWLIEAVNGACQASEEDDQIRTPG